MLLIRQSNIIILFLLFSFTAFAGKKITGRVLDESNQPVIGANVYWEKSRKGTTTDVNGYFELNKESSDLHLIASFIGYTSARTAIDESDVNVEIQLKGEIELQEVVVSERRAGTIASRTSVLQTQKITYDELCRAACCNLAESFETNPSVDVSYADAATGARQIKLLGLSGTYVQMLTENYPNFRGAASLYGLDYVPGTWMESIQVSKGTSSVKNGYEALAGQIDRNNAARPEGLKLFKWQFHSEVYGTPQTGTLSPYWVFDGEYFYYSQVVENGQTTAIDLLEAVGLADVNIPNHYKHALYTINIAAEGVNPTTAGLQSWTADSDLLAMYKEDALFDKKFNN